MSPSFAILPIILVILVLVGLIAGITLWITGGRSSGSGEMSCGSCGYAVRGLDGLNCPECGADLRMAGINRPKGGTARNVGIVLTICTGFLLLTCLGSALFWVQGSSTSIQSVPAQTMPPAANPTTSSPPASTGTAIPEDEENAESDTDDSATPEDASP
jgi:hypothetical protein